MEIKIENIYKSFGSNEVLRGVSLTIKEGSITAIIGGSGQGKTVLLKHLLGLLKPDEGKIFIDGENITRFSESGLAEIRKNIGMVFQTGGLLSSLTVGKNVGLGLREHRMEKEENIKNIVAEKLSLVGMTGTESLLPASLSGGMRKRVSIARALTMKPKTIIYDEPSTGLDPPMADNIDQLISDLSRKIDISSIIVTHDMLSVFGIADIVYMLHGGRIVATGTPDEIRKSDSEIVKDFIHRFEARV